MENQAFQIEELSFEPKKLVQVDNQRKIIDYYAKSESERPRKIKNDVLTREYIEGLFSVLEISPDRLHFVPEQHLCTEVNLFMQHARRLHYELGDGVEVPENTFIILVQGCLIKRQTNQSSLNSTLITSLNKIKRGSTRDSGTPKKKSSTIIGAAINFKKLLTRKYESNESLSPKLINHDFFDTKPYESRGESTVLQFPLSCRNSLQTWLQNREKQTLIEFLMTCLSTSDRKAIVKIVPKLAKINQFDKKYSFFQPNTIYMIYQGEVTLRSKTYQVMLNKNGIIYRKEDEPELRVEVNNSNTYLIAIALPIIEEALQQAYADTLELIKEKLQGLNAYRQNMWVKAEEIVQDREQVEPIFNSNILNMRHFTKNTLEEEKKKHFAVASAAALSTRFRKGLSIEEELKKLDSESCFFLGNYPYIKLLESQSKVYEIIKNSSPDAENRRLARQIHEDQQLREEKEKKRLYYMNKVRRLKVKNIASREIPNGHKKNFKVEDAQKQIKQNSLFSSIIEYPVNGVGRKSNEGLPPASIVRRKKLNTNLSLVSKGSHISENKREQEGLKSRETQFSTIYSKIQNSKKVERQHSQNQESQHLTESNEQVSYLYCSKPLPKAKEQRFTTEITRDSKQADKENSSRMTALPKTHREREDDDRSLLERVALKPALVDIKIGRNKSNVLVAYRLKTNN